MIVQQIKDVIRDIDSRNIDDLLITKGTLLALNVGYEDSLLDTPEWVIDGINSLSREITSRSRAELERELRREEASLEALSTREERRTKKRERVEALRKKLNQE